MRACTSHHIFLKSQVFQNNDPRPHIHSHEGDRTAPEITGCPSAKSMRIEWLENSFDG